MTFRIEIMKFYEIRKIEEKNYSSDYIDVMLMSKLFQDISKNTQFKTMEDVSTLDVVILHVGSFSKNNPEVSYHGKIKDGKKMIAYALIEPRKKINVQTDDENYVLFINNGQLTLTVPQNIDKMISQNDEPYKNLSPLEKKVFSWLESGHTGISSLTMCAMIFPQVKSHHRFDKLKYDIPHDFADLNRCMNFLEKIPEAKNELQKVKNASPAWKKLIDIWSEIEILYQNKDYKNVYEKLHSLEASKSLKM